MLLPLIFLLHIQKTTTFQLVNIHDCIANISFAFHTQHRFTQLARFIDQASGSEWDINAGFDPVSVQPHICPESSMFL